MPTTWALGARPAHAERAICAGCARDQLAVSAAAPMTWALCAQCARDLGSGYAHCAPNPVLVTGHCSGHCLNTVHRVFKKKKKSTKFLNIFLCMI